MATFASSSEAPSDRRTRLFRFLAFAGRYGHASIETCRRMTLRDLSTFCEEIATLLEDENRPPGS